MDEIQVPLPTQSRCRESLRLQHSWLTCKTNKLILHTRHHLKELVTVKVAMELIMMVKRTYLSVAHGMGQSTKKMSIHVVLSNN